MILYREPTSDEEHYAEAVYRWVVPVEPCEHGNYAPHDYLVEELSAKYGGMGMVAQCPGVKGNT